MHFLGQKKTPEAGDVLTPPQPNISRMEVAKSVTKMPDLRTYVARWEMGQGLYTKNKNYSPDSPEHV